MIQKGGLLHSVFTRGPPA